MLSLFCSEIMTSVVIDNPSHLGKGDLSFSVSMHPLERGVGRGKLRTGI